MRYRTVQVAAGERDEAKNDENGLFAAVLVWHGMVASNQNSKLESERDQDPDQIRSEGERKTEWTLANEVGQDWAKESLMPVLVDSINQSIYLSIQPPQFLVD